MPRAVRQSRLETRTARARLKIRHEPYWSLLGEGIHLGYRKGTRGGKWIVRRYDKDKRYRKAALGQADDHFDADGERVFGFFDAQTKARQWVEADRGVRSQLRPLTVSAVLEEYMDWFYQNRRSGAKTDGVVQRHIRPKLGAMRVDELTTKKIREWHYSLVPKTGLDDAQMQSRRTTANRILTILKAALNYGFREGLIETDHAWRRVKPFRGAQTARLVYLSTEQARRLMNACDPDFRELAQAALLTGGRYAELANLEVRDYLSDAATVQFRVTKNGKPRAVPLSDEGGQFFAALTAGRIANARMFLRANGEPWTASQQVRRMNAAREAARIDVPATFHSLRHTYASQMAMAGVSLQVIAVVLGHSDTRITEKHYAHLSNSYVAETVRAKLPKFGIRSEPAVVPLRRATL